MFSSTYPASQSSTQLPLQTFLVRPVVHPVSTSLAPLGLDFRAWRSDISSAKFALYTATLSQTPG